MKGAQSTASVVRNGATLSSLATLPAGSFAKVKFFTFQASVFSKQGGAVINQMSGAIRRFPRLSNGTYEMELWIPPADILEKALPGFTRQGR